MMIKTAFSTLGCPDWTWTDLLEKGPLFGYDGVELRLLKRETNLLAVDDLRASQRARRKRELDDAGFQICGLGSSVRFDETDEARRGEQLETGRAYLDLATELGAGFVRVFGDVLPDSPEPDVQRDAIKRIADGLQLLGEHGETVGVDVLIETHGDFSNSDVVRETLGRVTSPAVGTLWDTHHPWRFFGESLSLTYNRIAPWVRHTHFKDSVTGLQRDCSSETRTSADLAHALMTGHRHADYVLFGGGEFPIFECLALLKSAGYEGWLSLEWEKMWHPEIEDPEVALPLFPAKLRQFWDMTPLDDGNAGPTRG